MSRAANDVNGIVVASIPNGCAAVVWPPVPCVGCGRMAAMLISRDGHFLCLDCDKPPPSRAALAPLPARGRCDGEVGGEQCILPHGHRPPCVVAPGESRIVRADAEKMHAITTAERRAARGKRPKRGGKR